MNKSTAFLSKFIFLNGFILKICMREILYFTILKERSDIMKKRFFAFFLALTMLLGLIPAAAAEAAAIPLDEAHFSDPVFRAYIAEHFDPDKNGELSPEEIDSATSIAIEYEKITSAKGIEYLSKLTELQLEKCGLTELDVRGGNHHSCSGP